MRKGIVKGLAVVMIVFAPPVIIFVAGVLLKLLLFVFLMGWNVIGL